MINVPLGILVLKLAEADLLRIKAGYMDSYGRPDTLKAISWTKWGMGMSIIAMVLSFLLTFWILFRD